MNKKLKNRIKAYTGFAGALLASSQSDAQIIYTDVAPDDSAFYEVDMNNDGINEVIITSWSTYHTWGAYGQNYEDCGDSYLKTLNGQLFNLTYGNTCCNALSLGDLKAFNDSDLISNVMPPSTVLNTKGRIQNYHNYYTTSSSYHCFDGTFVQTPGDKFVGVKFLIAGAYHFGWIRVEVYQTSNYAYLILKDYAYESTPNVGILAGRQTSIAATEELFNSSVKVFAQNKQIKIDLLSGNKKTEISVFNLLGEKISSFNTTKQSEQIEIEKTGIYFVTISNERFTVKKKVIVF